MEKRIIKLETEQELIKQELDSYSDALKENTKSMQELTKILVRHDEQLRHEKDDEATRNAIITGIVVGVVVFVVTEVVHMI
jgi:lipid II:glycine glycyltransferase (peptidoglycan interpeptide bridge formation enzyme)